MSSISHIKSPTEVDHYQLRRVMDVYVSPAGEDLSGVLSRVEHIIHDITLPEGVRVVVRGSAQAMRTSFSAFGFGLILSTVLVYLVLVAQFQSFIDPLLILLAVPTGLTGVLLMLFLTGTTLNVMSLMGVVMMVGIVVSNSILIVEFTNRLRREGRTVREAVSLACRVRLRPVLMTSLATLIGLIPMALKLGTGSGGLRAAGARHHRWAGGLGGADGVHCARCVLHGASWRTVGGCRMRPFWLLLVAGAWAARVFAQTTSEPRTPPPAAPAAAVPLTLAQAHAIALQNHPQIAAATYQAQAQQQVYLQARSGLLPQITAFGDAVHADSDNTRLMAGGINNPSVFSRTAIGAGLVQLITDFGHTTNLAASARLQASAAEQNSLATREGVLLQVDQAYFAALQAHAIESVARQTFDTRQLLLDRVSVLAENKLKSDLDVSFAQVALEQARLLVQRAENDVDSSLATLSTVLGYREQRNFTLADETAVPVPANADVQPLVDQALHDRPELAGLRDERDAAQHLALSFRDARLPTISALVTGGNSPSHDARLPANYSAGGIQVSVPLFAGGLYEARQHEAELRARVAAESLRTVGGRHQPRRARRLAQPQQRAPAAAHQSAVGALRGECLPAGRCPLPRRQQLDRRAQPGTARAHDRTDRRDHGALRGAAARVRPQLPDRRHGARHAGPGRAAPGPERAAVSGALETPDAG